MNEAAKEKFIEIRDLFERMSHEMSVIVESYYIWRTLTFARSIPEVGKEQADRNASIMGMHNYFFHPTEYSHLQTFIIGLMKFFDRNPRSLSIARLIKELEQNKDSFTPEVIRSVYPDRFHNTEIKQSYSPIDRATIDRIEAFRNKHEHVIEKLKDIRDKQFTHVDLEKIEGKFTPNEVEALINDVQEMFNKLSGNFDRSTTHWGFMKEESVRGTKFLLENLERGEAQRKKEIEEKWG